jgi:hypothetical protein
MHKKNLDGMNGVNFPIKELGAHCKLECEFDLKELQMQI